MKKLFGLLLIFVLSTTIFITVFYSIESVAGNVEKKENISIDNNLTNNYVANIEILNQFGGRMKGIAISGTYAYVGIGSRLQILDITNPITPTLLSGSDVLDGNITTIILSGTHAFVGSNIGLQILDISNSTTPVQLGMFETTSSTLNIAVLGTNVYVVDEGAGLRIIDISNPSNPKQIGFYQASDVITDITISNEHAYIAAGDAGLRILNIATPSDPVEIGYYDINTTSTFANNVVVSGTYAYLTYKTQGLYIVDISDPTNPVYVSSFDNSNRQIADIGIEANIIFIVQLASSVPGPGASPYLQIIDISSPTNPNQIASYDVSQANGLAVSEKKIYITGSYYGLYIIDISVPSAPMELGTFLTKGSVGIGALANNYAYVITKDGFIILDVTNPMNPIQVATYGGLVGNMVVASPYVYVSDGPYLHILDITTITNPILLGVHNIGNYISDFAISDTHAYVLVSNDLVIFDVSNPITLTEVGSIDNLPDAGYGIEISGGYAYVAASDFSPSNSSTHSIIVVDINNPLNPMQMGIYYSPGEARYSRDIAISGTYAYLADVDKGLRIVDITSPMNPYEIGYYEELDMAVHIDVSGHFVYIADLNSGLSILDVADPSNPVSVGAYNKVPFGNVIVSGTTAFMNWNVSGFWIFGVEFLTALSHVEIEADQSVAVQKSLLLTATILPDTPTLPITYTWELEGLDLIVHAGSLNVMDTASIQWETPGIKTVTVYASSPANTVTNTIEISVLQDTYLPLIKK